MDNIYNIFQREKERVGDDFTVFYNKQKNSIQYKNDEGMLTVLIDAEKGSESFYFKEPSEQGLGELVQKISEHGFRAELASSFTELPDAFIDLAQSYQYDRKAIGIEKESEKPKTKQSYERD